MKQKPIFISGQGCRSLDTTLSKSWRESFCFVPLANATFSKQARCLAQRIIDEGWSNPVLVGHSAGCIVALLAAIYLKRLTGGLQSARKVFLLAPPPLLGNFPTGSIALKLLRNPRYWLKALPWAKPFRLTESDSNELMFGSDTEPEMMENFFEQDASDWFPRLITETFFSPFTGWRNFDWRSELKEEELHVVAGTEDGLIPFDLCKRTAWQLGALFTPHVGASHLGMVLGNWNQILLNLLTTEEEPPTWAMDKIWPTRPDEKGRENPARNLAFAH